MRDQQTPSSISQDRWSPSGFTISSNPPNPKTSFRTGDWICSEPNCSAHNFGRNSNCIGCGSERQPIILRPDHLRASSTSFYLSTPMARLSPRFAASAAGYPMSPVCTDIPRVSDHAATRLRTHSSPGALSASSPFLEPIALTAPTSPTFAGMGPRTSSPYPLLTPSGRAISIGGRVQNVSYDPLAPCIMYWPDNEPLPEQGQIRPSGSTIISYPPIINTGNKGAAEKQPGDWVCQKCHYLNWRRRKVCQTCFPYAEGNGDSISAAVQAERIALLENVLATEVEHTRNLNQSHSVNDTRANSIGAGLNSVSNNGVAFPSADSPTKYSPPTSPWPSQTAHGPSHPMSRHARSQEALAYQAAIYQTPDGLNDAHARLPRSPVSTVPVHTPKTSVGGGSLLPGFLADIVHSDSPSLSPSTSTSSADLSLEEYDDPLAGMRSRGVPYGRVGRAHGGSGNVSTSSLSSASLTIHENSIWKMDGEELGVRSKPSPLSSATDLMGLAAAVNSLSITPPAIRRSVGDSH